MVVGEVAPLVLLPEVGETGLQLLEDHEFMSRLPFIRELRSPRIGGRTRGRGAASPTTEVAVGFTSAGWDENGSEAMPGAVLTKALR